MDLLRFLAVEFGVVGIALGIFGIVVYFDRLTVSVMRRCGVHLYPTAIAIAMLIIDHPEQWSSDQFRMSHPDIGSIWIANEAYGLKVETAFGDWKPNTIERRIIRDAVDWRINQYVRNRIANAIQRSALASHT